MSTYLVHKHKHGDTFDLSGVAQLVAGQGADLTGWSGASQIRDESGDIIETLTFAWLDASVGTCRITSVDDTSAWPVGRAYFDVEFTTDTGKIVSTPTVTVLIGEDNTR